MAIFELVFIFLFFASVITLITSAVIAFVGRSRTALRILRIYAVCLGTYLAICLLSALLTPRGVFNIGDPQCYDDWCIALDIVDKTPGSTTVAYRATIRVFSRARRVTQRENGLAVYLEDDRGNRYPPLPDASATPFSVLLQPGESVTTTRTFNVPVGAQVAGFVATHEGGFPIGWFIIGEGGSLFHKEAITRFE